MAENKPPQPRPGAPAAGPAALLQAEIERLKAKLIEAEWKIAELEARADVDPLLDILNRRGFERELVRSIAYVKRHNTAAAVIYIDLDGFKAVNDKYGHAVGDVLLKTVAHDLIGHVRASDVVGRLGGDEFAVLMWNCNEAQAVTKSRDLETLIARISVTADGARVSVGASTGIVPLSGETTPEAVIAAADKAMYVRKKERRG